MKSDKVRKISRLSAFVRVHPWLMNIPPSRFRSFAFSRHNCLPTLWLLAVLGCAGCGHREPPKAMGMAPSEPPIRFRDVATERSVRFRHTSGASGRLYLAETVGSGAALFDYDNDGRLD